MVLCSSGLLPCLPLQGRTQLEGHPLHSDPHRFLFSPYHWPSAIITNGILNTSPEEITRNISCLPDPHCFMLFSTAFNSVFILHSFQSSSSSSVAFQTPCVLSVLTGLSCLCHYSTVLSRTSLRAGQNPIAQDQYAVLGMHIGLILFLLSLTPTYAFCLLLF